MLHLDASSAECLVLTCKEGLLSAVAHDLEIRVERFELSIDEATLAVSARFDAASLRVVTARQEGAPRPEALGEADKQKIERSLAADVLHAAAHPFVTFTSTAVVRLATEADGFRVSGELTLHGATRPLSFAVRPRGDRMVAEVQLHQPSFGIKPFSAMLGALKVKPDVTVLCSVPRASLPAR